MTTYPKMNKAIKDLLRSSAEPMYQYAAQRLEELETELSAAQDKNRPAQKTIQDVINENVLAQAHILAVERRPEACLDCGFEHSCSLHGCAVINRLIKLAEEASDEHTSQREN